MTRDQSERPDAAAPVASPQLPQPLHTAGRLGRETLLWVGAVLGTLALVVTVASAAFSITPLIFQSGSMAPAYEAGALGFAREVPATELMDGDVVSVVDDREVRVTHRIVEIVHGENTAELTLRGDANHVTDPRPYVVEQADRVLFAIPGGGYVVAWLLSPPGLLTVGVLVGTLMFLGFVVPPPAPTDRRHRARATGSRRGLATVAAVTLVATGLTGTLPIGTQAAWQDEATAVTGDLTAHEVPTPQPNSCNVTGNAVTGYTATIQWPATTSPHAYTYTATLRQNGANLNVTSPTADTRQVQVTSGLLSSLLGRTVQIDIRSQAPDANWTSQRRVRDVQVALLGLTLTCGGQSTAP